MYKDTHNQDTTYNFYASEGKEYKWPKLDKWTPCDWDDIDVFGDASKVGYQLEIHNPDSNTVTVYLDGNNIANGTSPFGTWSYDFYGVSASGIFTLDGLPDLLESISKDLPSILKAQFKKLPIIEGYIFNNNCGLVYEAEKGDLIIGITIHDEHEFFLDQKVNTHISIIDYGNYSQHTVKEWEPKLSINELEEYLTTIKNKYFNF